MVILRLTRYLKAARRGGKFTNRMSLLLCFINFLTQIANENNCVRLVNLYGNCIKLIGLDCLYHKLYNLLMFTKANQFSILRKIVGYLMGRIINLHTYQYIYTDIGCMDQ